MSKAMCKQMMLRYDVLQPQSVGLICSLIHLNIFFCSEANSRTFAINWTKITIWEKSQLLSSTKKLEKVLTSSLWTLKSDSLHMTVIVKELLRNLSWFSGLTEFRVHWEKLLRVQRLRPSWYTWDRRWTNNVLLSTLFSALSRGKVRQADGGRSDRWGSDLPKVDVYSQEEKRRGGCKHHSEMHSLLLI